MTQAGARSPRLGILIDRLVLGGVEKTAIEEVRALRELGVDATLLVLKRDRSIPAAVQEWISGLPVVYLDDRIPRWLRLSWKIPGFSFFSLFHLLYPAAIPLRVARKEWDAVVSHNSYTTLTAWSLSRFRAIPYSMFVWDPIASVLVNAYPSGLVAAIRPLVLPAGRWVDRMLARGARQLIAGSRTYVQYLSSFLRAGASIVVAPPGCVPAKTARAAAGRYLYTATSWKEGKQLEVLLKALTKLPEAELVIGGRWLHPSYHEQMAALVQELGLGSRVKITGELSENDMARYAAGALCSVTTNAERGFGMPALEAAAQGCTFVCPRIAGVGAYFTDGVEAFYYEEGNSDQLAAVLRPLIKDHDLALRAGVAAWERARSTLTWRHHAITIANAVGQPVPAQLTV